MAPKSSFAPKIWKRPYNHIYNDNYRYGNSLYCEQIGDIERKYNEALAGTRFRSDRPDLGLSTFADSQLIGASAIAKDRTDRATEGLSSERVRSISTSRVNSYLEDRDRKLAHSPSYDSYSSSRALERVNSEIEESRLRRSASRRSVRSARPESLYSSSFENSLANGGADETGPRKDFWMERWYRNSMRSVAHDLYPTSLLKTMVPVWGTETATIKTTPKIAATNLSNNNEPHNTKFTKP